MKLLPIFIVLAAAGCGTRHLDQEIVQDGPWTDNTEGQFCKSMAFQYGGQAVVTFRGGDGDVEIPASYAVSEAKVAAGMVEVRYEATEVHQERYRAALVRWKSAHEVDARTWPAELPKSETFQATARPGLTLVRADGTIIKLSARWEH